MESNNLNPSSPALVQMDVERDIGSSRDDYYKHIPGTNNHNERSATQQGVLATKLFLPTDIKEGPRAPGVSDLILSVVSPDIPLYKMGTVLHDKPQPKHVVGAGRVSFVPPYHSVSHSWQVPSVEAVTVSLLSIPQQVIAQTALEVFDIDPVSIEFIGQFGLESPVVSALAIRLTEEMAQNNPQGSLYAGQIASSVVMEVIRNHSVRVPVLKAVAGGLAPHILRRVLDYLHAYFAQDLKLREVAAIAGLSTYHFQRQFKCSTGLTPNQYQARCRIDRAKQLLATTQMSLLDIAFEVGYKSYQGFYHQFLSSTNISPRLYRQQLQR